MKRIIDYTLEELKELPYDTDSSVRGKKYNQIIIVPTDELHESGYICMKYVLIMIGMEYPPEIVAVVGGYSDVLHLSGGINAVKANIDCLPNSKCLRVIFYEDMTVPYFIGSDFYAEREDWEKENAE